VHLKSLTLRGFKSFASATTLRFEPGITCVVGPNGSGKSNVVDALAWVMGEQGAKSLRGGKMEDVIFAGTAGRPPLGRAEVTLTIDNSDGALPIDYAEVTLSRIMFRNGGSEYAINGDSCRLLDIQELLSDSGIGREMHVIVGQGQLDSILSATPEDRRGFIEEAAGVLKHRKRKEKALRKLDAMQANLTRLQDLTVELRRQLKPLGRQAEVARKAAVVQADLRDARLRLLADDLLALRSTLEQEVADETALRERQADVERALAAAREQEAGLEQAISQAAPRLARAQETWYRLSSLCERFRGTAGLAAERARHLAAEAAEPEEERLRRDPEDLEREGEETRRQEAELAAGAERARSALQVAVGHRQATEAALVAEEQRVASLLRAAADRREGLARLQGKVNGLRSRAAAAEAEIGRLTAALDGARERSARAQREFAALEARVAGLDEGEVGLDAAHEEAAAALERAEQRVAQLQEQDRAVERERAALLARTDALEMGLARKDGAGALLAAADRVSGLLGSVAALLSVEPGYESAVAAALGAAADAVAVVSVDAAVASLRMLKDDDAGRVGLLVGGVADDDPVHEWPRLPPGARYAVDLVSAPEPLGASLRRLLRRVAVVDGLAEARALISDHPQARAVTREGDVLGPDFAVGGSASAPSLLEMQAAAEEARQQLVESSHRCERVRFELAQAMQARSSAGARADETLSRLNESDAAMAAVAEQLGHLGAAARSAAAEADRLAQAIHDAEQARDRDLAGLADLEQRLANAEADPDGSDPGADERDQRSAACSAARHKEMEARLVLRTGEERMRALAGRADALQRSAAEVRAARERAVARRELRTRQARLATAVARAASYALQHVDASLTRAGQDRTQAAEERNAREAELTAVRNRERALAAELEQLTDGVHRDEVARAEQRLRIEQVEQRALEEFGVDPEGLVADYGPDQPVPVLPDPDAPEQVPEPVPYVRAEQQKRLRTAERALALLGKVNPLALEEFAALEERHKFLTEQLEDLKATRRDLLTVIKEVDERVEQVFTAAYEDTARAFETVFARLFPGGEGRLVLTDPNDMLTTGIEVEARPPGKKVKRLSLLSGGERSLVASALLVAIFKARPSPFYVLDEVEAALDDTNLGRLITIMEELRESSQLIVITHQKRTMEVADALYGVSMRGDGVTAVISQRLREDQPA
jgi:chromosome segregation protein